MYDAGLRQSARNCTLGCQTGGFIHPLTNALQVVKGVLSQITSKAAVCSSFFLHSQETAVSRRSGELPASQAALDAVHEKRMAISQSADRQVGYFPLVSRKGMQSRGEGQAAQRGTARDRLSLSLSLFTSARPSWTAPALFGVLPSRDRDGAWRLGDVVSAACS